jgi:hydrogenase maturation protease
MTAHRTLVAGVGNVFLGDDGFGVEVARRLMTRDQPDGVEIADFGIRGVHLAYELLDGCELLVLVDAAPRGEAPGTLSVVDLGPVPREDDAATSETEPAVVDAGVMMNAHGMQPDTVLTLVETLGGSVGRAVLVACEPEDVTDLAGLSPGVSAALDQAVHLVERLVSSPGSILPDYPDDEDGPTQQPTGTPPTRSDQSL